MTNKDSSNPAPSAPSPEPEPGEILTREEFEARLPNGPKRAYYRDLLAHDAALRAENENLLTANRELNAERTDAQLLHDCARAEAEAERTRADARLLAEWIDQRYDGAPDAKYRHIGEDVCAALDRALAAGKREEGK